jgi:N-acylneuraminate cytidylyltransferase|tara:strand:- start:624 stop:1280 length:657 start_codon:yes stop_codon:yes gene_type:complete
MVIYGLIPLRKRSIRIKNKNFIKIQKKPLFMFAAQQALNSRLISKVFISTDSNKIKINNKKLFVIKRSKASTTKNASTEILIKEFLKKYSCDYLVLIQATNLFIKSKYLDKAIYKLIKNTKEYDSLLSVVSSKYLIWRKKKNCIFSHNYDYKKRPRSQDIKQIEYIENGSFYIFKRKNFLKSKNRLHGRITYFEMPKETIFEIDEKEDLKVVKKLITK